MPPLNRAKEGELHYCLIFPLCQKSLSFVFIIYKICYIVKFVNVYIDNIAILCYPIPAMKIDKVQLAEFGKRVKAERINLKLSQAQLANLVGRDVTTISRWEKGERNPSQRSEERRVG